MNLIKTYLDLCNAKDSDTCLQESGDNWKTYTCATSLKWCKSWAKDTRRCCPKSCGTGVFSKNECIWFGGKRNGDCKYPNEAQPSDSRCQKG